MAALVVWGKDEVRIKEKLWVQSGYMEEFLVIIIYAYRHFKKILFLKNVGPIIAHDTDLITYVCILSLFLRNVSM